MEVFGFYFGRITVNLLGLILGLRVDAKTPSMILLKKQQEGGRERMER